MMSRCAASSEPMPERQYRPGWHVEAPGSGDSASVGQLSGASKPTTSWAGSRSRADGSMSHPKTASPRRASWLSHPRSNSTSASATTAAGGAPGTMRARIRRSDRRVAVEHRTCCIAFAMLPVMQRFFPAVSDCVQRSIWSEPRQRQVRVRIVDEQLLRAVSAATRRPHSGATRSTPSRRWASADRRALLGG
jgi:hypothetical protein